MEDQHKAEMTRKLDNLLAAQALEGRAVFLFGHCNATEEMADHLLSGGIAPAAILDNSRSKQGCAYRSIPITPPEVVTSHVAGSSIVLIATRFYAEMTAQLRRLGYCGEIVQVVEYHAFAECSLSDETVFRKTERMERGRKTLAWIWQRYPSRHLVFCPFGAFGDVYWAMAFLPHYCRKNGIGEVAVMVVGETCRQVAEMFGAAPVIPLNQSEMDELVQAVIYTGAENCIIAHHDRPYTDNLIKWLDRHFLSFLDYYRCGVYGLPKDTPPAAPSSMEPFANHSGIPQGRSVILSPYAKSVVALPHRFWERVARDCAASGFSVYTNVAGDEQALRGTQPLRLPLPQLIRAAEYAGAFIGLRSGLCDLLYSADCRKVVVFPDCCYSTTPHKVAEFFALPGWEQIVCKEGAECPL